MPWLSWTVYLKRLASSQMGLLLGQVRFSNKLDECQTLWGEHEQMQEELQGSHMCTCAVTVITSVIDEDGLYVRIMVMRKQKTML